MNADALDYIEKVRWQFAKTMPEWPHEYTVKAWEPDLTRAFVSFCALIARDGVTEPWPPPPAPPIYHNRYLVLGEHKYWAMGPNADRDPPDAMTVINRALMTVRPNPDAAGP